MKALVVEDETKSRETLERMLSRYCPEVEVQGSAATLKNAREWISSHSPDLIFLDIELSDGNGFDLLRSYPEADFSVIFTTAYQEYALKALKASALDFLEKPIDIQELIAAVNKARAHREGRELKSRYKHLLQHLSENTGSKVAVPTMQGATLVEREEILRCEAEGSYSRIYLRGGQQLYTTRGLKAWEEMLDKHHFFRIHHSHLINVNAVAEYVKGEGGYVVLEEGSHLNVSRRKKEGFLEALGLI